MLAQDDPEITSDFWLHGLTMGTGARGYAAYNWINEAKTFGVRASGQVGRSAEWPDSELRGDQGALSLRGDPDRGLPAGRGPEAV